MFNRQSFRTFDAVKRKIQLSSNLRWSVSRDRMSPLGNRVGSPMPTHRRGFVSHDHKQDIVITLPKLDFVFGCVDSLLSQEVARETNQDRNDKES